MKGYWDRFLKYKEGGPEAIDGWPTPIPAARFNEIVETVLGAALADQGFERLAPRRWVRTGPTSIRHLVDLSALKGVAYAPMWGLSLDFVPHLTGAGKVAWHRTSKSARFDLVHRPIDYARTDAESQSWTMSPMATEEELAFDLRRVTTLTVEHVAAFLRRTAEIDDLPTAYADQRARPATGLGFDCFPQQVLAEAFVLARCGLPNAHEVLREYLEASAVAEATALQIEGLLREARLVRER